MALTENETLPALFQQAVKEHGEKVALRWRENREWKDLTYAQLAEQIEITAAGLRSLGVGHGDRVAIYSENQPAWVMVDLACHALGAINASIYPTLPAPQVAFIVNNCQAKVLIAGNSKLFQNARLAQADAPCLEQIVLIDGVDDGALRFADLQEKGRQNPFAPGSYAEQQQKVQPDDVAALIYTSGTTGDPKGAMLTHRNFASNVVNSLAHFAAGGIVISSTDTFLSFLPLSHSFERIGCYLALSSGSMTVYSEGPRTLQDEMQTAKPTLMLCVPRIWELIQERTLDTVAKAGDMKKAAFEKALEIAKECVREEQAGKQPGRMLSLQRATADKLVFAPIRERFGGSFRLLVSGGAALNPETALFWRALGLNLVEGYGLTETSPVICVNPGNRPRIGTVGTVIPNGEVRIAADGEICYRGANVMKGYWQNEQATRDMIDSDGWLHTGDIGQLDSDGYLKITDRKKDIIVLANGKNVSPLPIESALKGSPFITEVVLIGDKQNVVTALVIPNKERLREAGFSNPDDSALLADPAVKKKIKEEIDVHSKALADFEKVRKFTLLNAAFTIDTGELTPTLKVKRKVVVKKYAKEIAEMRGDEG